MKTINFCSSTSTRGIICIILLLAGYLPSFSHYVHHHPKVYKLPASAYHVPTVASAINTNPFSDAFQVAFNAASSNFTGLKGSAIAANNFNTTLTVADPMTASTNIFYKSNMWAFRFNITGASNAESDYFDLFSATVEQTLTIHRLRYSKTNVALGRADALPSVKYITSEYFIQINRIILGNTFSDEVIIYHRGYAID
jgi:hypothetical protein